MMFHVVPDSQNQAYSFAANHIVDLLEPDEPALKSPDPTKKQPFN
jgi:hypothetical protein